MKKSFMTRALATGLSLAMAFSLSAATNVTTAAAAAKPAMKSSKMTIKVGQSKNYQATAATQKSYKISKIKLSAAGKTKVTAKVNSGKKSIKLTGKAATKSTNVVITFKNNKTKKLTKVTTKAVVKEAEKPDEAYKINSATATGVKTITVELNKAVANAASVSAVVKKGTAARESKFTVDGSKIVIAMDAKLTAGEYTVTLEGLEATALTANVNVEKDETLTSFEIADYIVAKSTTATTTGTIKFAALNQYGEKMVSTEPTVTCSFGTVANQKPVKPATATAEGVIEVTDISPMLAIIGTKGTVVLVGDMGVTATKEISYNSAATASTVEVAGTYHKNSATLKNITEGDAIADYELLLTAKDQYGYAMSADEFKDVNASLAGGLTNLAIKLNGQKIDYTTRTLDGVDYIAIPLEGNNGKTKAVAGDATLTIVNPFKGLLTTTTITVVKNVIIKSLNITADNGVYAKQDNELSFEAIDADGKSVTSYAVLSNLLGFANAPGLRIEKNKDGSAKMIYKPTASPEQAGTDKASQPAVLTVTANSQVGGEYLVKTFTFTVYQTRYAKSVLGVAADQTTSISSKDTAKSLVIKSSKLILADQYSNKVVDGEDAFNDAIFDTTANQVTGTAIYVATNGAINVSVTGKAITATPVAVGTATVYMKYNYDATKTVTASSSNYDAKFTISVFDTAGVEASGLEIKSVNDGFAVKAADASGAALKAKLKVVAKVGGTETEIPASQYEIVKCENNSFTTDDDAKNVKTKTAKVTVQVTTWDSSNTNIETQITKEFEVSRADEKLFKVTKAKGASEAALSISGSAAVLNADNFVSGFEFKNQYGIDATASDADATSVKYDIRLVSLGADTPSDGYTITSGGLNSAKVQFTKAGKYVLKITATTEDGSSKDYQLTVTVGNN